MNILGRPYVDFSSIYRLAGSGPHDCYFCTEKASGIKYVCRILYKHQFRGDKETLRSYVQIWQRMSVKRHPNILELKAAYEDAEHLYLVLELFSEDTLDEWKAANKNKLEEEVVYLFWQVLNAVHGFHSMGVMVRNLDLYNFKFVSADKGKPVIKAAIYRDSVFINEENLYVSSFYAPTYAMAPEIKNNHNYGKEVDLWGAGAILYKLLTGAALGRGIGLDDLDNKINKDLSGKSDSAKDLLKRMLKLDPKLRITAAKALGNLYVSSFYAPTYAMAPEIKNNHNYGKEVDLWGAGAILYKLLTGAALDRGIGLDDLDNKINKDLSGKSDSAKDLLKRMLKLDPKLRITAAKALEHPWFNSVNVMRRLFPIFARRFSSMIEMWENALSEEENQHLKQLLNNIDTYGSTMTSEELKIGLSSLLTRVLSESKTKELDDAVDDFYSHKFVIDIMQRHALENENIHKAFMFFDKDNDGFITREDLGHTVAPFRIASEAAIDEIIDDVDTEKDGKINYSEFKAMIQNEMREYTEKQRVMKF